MLKKTIFGVLFIVCMLSVINVFYNPLKHSKETNLNFSFNIHDDANYQPIFLRKANGVATLIGAKFHHQKDTTSRDSLKINTVVVDSISLHAFNLSGIISRKIKDFDIEIKPTDSSTVAVINIHTSLFSGELASSKPISKDVQEYFKFDTSTIKRVFTFMDKTDTLVLSEKILDRESGSICHINVMYEGLDD